MAFQSVPGTVEVVVDFVVAGTPTANTMKFFRAGTITQAHLDALTAGLDSNVGFQYAGILAQGDQYVQVRARGLENPVDLASSSGAAAFTEAGIIHVGLASSLSLCLTLRTANTGRSARGRWFHQRPLVLDMESANLATSGYGADCVSRVQAFITEATSLGWTPVIVSRFAAKAKRPVGVTFPITSVVARNLRVDSQRGRMPAPE